MKMIPLFDAGDFPPEVEEYCVEHDFPVHCSSGIVEVDLDEPNPLAGWILGEGYEFPAEDWDRGFSRVGIMGT